MMSSGPELAAVPVGAEELFDAPTAPGAVAAVAASRVWTLSVTAFFRYWVREKGFHLPRHEGKQSPEFVAYLV